MTLKQALSASEYTEATIVLSYSNMRYNVDEDGVVTSGIDGMPASIIPALPVEVEASTEWEPVGEADC